MFTKEDYVSLETAKLLKKKGYDRPCNASRLKDGTLRIYDKTQSLDTMLHTGTECLEFLCPTLYEAQMWLLKEHNLYVEVGIWGDYSVDKYGNKVDERQYWAFDIYLILNITNNISDDCDREYKTYQEALDAGIRKALKLIPVTDKMK